MSALSFPPVLFLFALALCTLWAIDKITPLLLPTAQRISSIDGLRGYLAFGVFLHHSCIWYFFLRSGQWTEPPAALYTQLGQASVALFFMITGFLFTGKLLEAAPSGTDWLRLYVSRVMRIAPLWLAVKVVVVLLALMVKRLHLDSGNPAHLANTASTGLMTAGVTWTLYFEWTFYFMLPWLALALKKRPPVLWLVLSIIAVALVGGDRLYSIFVLAFLAGIAAAGLIRITALQNLACSVQGSVITAALLLTVYTGFKTAYAPVPMLLLGLAFVLIAAGCSLFGLLNLRLSRVFGEITFSIYLLHGVLLYVAYRLIVGLDMAAHLSWAAHWWVTAAVTPCLVAVSYLSYRYLEMPAMRKTTAVTAWLRQRALRQNPGPRA